MVDAITKDVTLHELAHGFGDAVACVQLGYERSYYDGSSVRMIVRYASGEALFSPPLSDQPTQSDVDKVYQIASLSSLTPCAALPKTDIFKQYRNGTEDELFAKAGLSDKDLELYANWGGPRLAPLKTIIATQMLFDDLGFVGKHKLLKLVRRVSNQRQFIALPDLVPYDRARKAVERASSLVSGMIGDAKPREAWRERQ